MVDYKNLMIESLSDHLEENETLSIYFYGTLVQKKKNYFGFFGITDGFLINTLLDESQKQIDWFTRVPLDIKDCRIKKSLIPGQYVITISFNEGNPCKIRVSKKVYKIDCQEKNVTAFIEYLEQKRYLKGSYTN